MKEGEKMVIKKNLMLICCIVVLVMMISGCSLLASTEDSEFPDLPTTQTAEIKTDHLTLKLNFKGEILRADGSKKSWNQENMKPFIDSLEGWSKVIKGVKGKEYHTLTIDVHVNDFNGGNGAATPDYSSLVKAGDKTLPTQGYIVINNRLYDTPEAFESPSEKTDVMSEFNANIYHEMGHVFGIGSLWQVFDDAGKETSSIVEKEKTTGKGNVSYYMPKTVAAYNKIFGTQLDFVPISDDGGHYYDYEKADDKKRTEGIWKNVKGVPYDLMANGHTITMITASGLEDLGWDVDYSHVKAYEVK